MQSRRQRLLEAQYLGHLITAAVPSRGEVGEGKYLKSFLQNAIVGIPSPGPGSLASLPLLPDKVPPSPGLAGPPRRPPAAQRAAQPGREALSSRSEDRARDTPWLSIEHPSEGSADQSLEIPPWALLCHRNPEWNAED